MPDTVPNLANGVITGLCPNARPDYRQAFTDHGDQLIAFGVDTPWRLAHLLAQVLHECGRLTIARESMNYTASRILKIFGVGEHSAKVTPAEAETLAGQEKALAERVYGLGNPGKARDLGNTEPGDGWRYRGGGLLQTTGRDAYRRYGRRIGADLEGTPDLITDPAYALLPALHEWKDGGCSALADTGDIEAITRKINGGTIGLEERKALLVEINAALLQIALLDAGFNPGPVDGKPGPGTRKAVSAFQTAEGLPVTGVGDTRTLAALGLIPVG